MEKGADTLITTGAAQSNHCRQTAAVAALAGLRCVLVLTGEPTDALPGNLLLDRIFGAQVRWSLDRPASQVMDEVASEIEKKGGHPYIIPLGGSSAIGAVGHVEGMLELAEQAKEAGQTFDRIVFCTSSGGGQAGMIVGARALGLTVQILGVSAHYLAAEMRPWIQRWIEDTDSLLDLDVRTTREDIVVRHEYIGPGYGMLSEDGREAILLTARTEGILLDPVYTGKAMAGLVDLVRRGEIGRREKVLFWHTGGVPALFALSDGFRTAG
jgi:D-cysteine desulfhydrase